MHNVLPHAPYSSDGRSTGPQLPNERTQTVARLLNIEIVMVTNHIQFSLLA